MKKSKLIKLAFVSSLLFSDSVFANDEWFFKPNPEQETKNAIEEIKQKSRPSPKLEATKLRELKLYSPFELKSRNENNPFSLGKFVTDTTIKPIKKEAECTSDDCGDGAPIKHEPYFLESFDLSKLIFVGTIVDKGDKIILISTPNAGIARTRLGEYIGKNNGRIIEVNKDNFVIQEKYREARGWRNKVIVKTLNN